MFVYIDLLNLLSLIHSSKEPQYKNCISLLKENLDIKFTFSKNCIQDLEEEDKDTIMLWLRTMTDGNCNIKWNSTFPKDPINTDDFKNPSYNSSIYLLDEEKRDIKKLIEKGTLLISAKGDEIKTLSKLFIKGNQFTKNIFNEVQQWDDLGKYTSPCSDIIIVDSYIFASKELYDSNIIKLAKILSSHSLKEKLNIVIITLNKVHDPKMNIEFEPNWNDLYSKLRKAVCNQCHCRPNITFIAIIKGNLREHDRTIFTNYKLFSSGDSYNYFDSKGEKITNGRYLHAHSLADKDNWKDSKVFLEKIQELIDRMNTINKDCIKKDKVCNFLKF